MCENKNVYKILEGNPVGRRTLGTLLVDWRIILK
jgi:hypothetical protein